MFASIILSGLLHGVRAQALVYDNAAASNNAGGNVNYDSSNLPPIQQVWQQPAVAIGPPAPILASEFIQSGQLPTYQPHYVSNAQGYFVPILVDVDGELPPNLEQSLVDAAQLEQLQGNAAVVPRPSPPSPSPEAV